MFEIDPDDSGELEAVQELLTRRNDDTLFVALTQNDLPITKAQELRKIGIDEVLPVSIDGEGLKAAVNGKTIPRTLPQLLTSNGKSALGRVIPVAKSRGGIGASTVAVNLACSLVGGKGSLFRKTEKKRVALLDLDLQFGNANVFLDLEDNGGCLQFIENSEEPDDHFLTSILQSHTLGIDVLCAPAPLVPLQSIHTKLLDEMLNLLQRRYDYIVIDLPCAVVEWVEPIFKRATRLALVTDTSVPCVRQTRRLIDFYREANVSLPVEVIVNREPKTMLKPGHVREAEKVLKTKLKHWLPENLKVARKSVDLGRPIVDMKPGSDLGKALTRLAEAMSEDVRQMATKNK
ncbi:MULTISPECIES: AAA family ATPase [unclassified Ruegeria]|uniref:AAA family ATPase n=1 Tax=unclassified Ruegeria TaxID=2625375 RepID=UPI001491F79F|nr:MULTISPECIES: AAA family ATPase [unclassified Ruegeria]NOD88214.1 AAA family ATPase [Ruegeria sp. HKCCD4318]NOE13123.1 AAA family ATPase [Ruegeria sp. HKCCD4318-2]NOG11335.1 AAA family ATPase [Ruegeria sp. HKCCD4315]